MKAIVDKDLCVGCGLCEEICPDVYEMKDDGKSYVKINPVPAEFIACSKEAEDQCPVQAISHEE